MEKIKSTELSRDEMILWADKNMGSIIGSILGLPKRREISKERIGEINSFLEAGYREEKSRLLKLHPPNPTKEESEKIAFIDSLFKGGRFVKKLGKPPNFNFHFEEIVWQYPIKNGRSIVGFADLSVLGYEDTRLRVRQLRDSTLHPGTFSPWLNGSSKYLSPPSWTTDIRFINFLFIVDLGSSSLTEVIRKIRTYENYEDDNVRKEWVEDGREHGDLTNNRFFIISSNKRMGSILEERGIGFLPYGKDFKKEKINAEKIREET